MIINFALEPKFCLQRRLIHYLKCFLKYYLNYQPSIERTAYSQADNTALAIANEANGATTAGSGSLYIGIDLENYVNANKDNIFAGFNSNTDDIFAIMNFAGYAGGAATVRFDAFAMFDTCVVFENGTCYVRY